MKWNELYPNEKSLLLALLQLDISLYKQRLCKGYEFIESFQKAYRKNGELSSKQLTQLKRLAVEIHKYHTW